MSKQDISLLTHGTSDAEPLRPQTAREHLSPLAVLNLLLRHLRILVVLPLLTAIFAVLLGKITPPEYTAYSSFSASPEGANVDGAAVLAGRFGLNLGTGGGVSLPFFADVLSSRELLVEVARHPYQIDEGFDEPRAGPLMDVLELETEGGERQRLNAAVGFLRDALEVNLKRDPGIVEVRTSAANPQLAEAINERLLIALEDFSLRRRRQQAAAEISFLRARLAEASGELQTAETAVTEFLELNRQYQGAPQLTQELSQLRRRVDMRQEVYMGLTGALDKARLEEARDVPTITVVDEPQGSARRSDYPAIVNAALGGILGLVAAILAILAMEFLRHMQRERPDEYRELQEHLLRLRRKLRRRLGRRSTA